MSTAFFLLTVALIAVHITACAKGMRKLGTWTKPFLVPMMGLSWFSALTAMGIDFPLWPAVLLGLICYTAGDIFLLSSRKGLFLAGMVAFALGHISFATLFMQNGLSGMALMVFAVLWCSAYIFFLSPQFDWKDRETKFLASYSVFVMLFGIVAGGSTFGNDIWAHIAAVAGTIVFALSDSLILYQRKRKTDMSAIVMITYISAVALLLAGAFALAL